MSNCQNSCSTVFIDEFIRIFLFKRLLLLYGIYS